MLFSGMCVLGEKNSSSMACVSVISVVPENFRQVAVTNWRKEGKECDAFSENSNFSCLH